MNKLFYFDTSIWLDFLEDRNEPNLPKSTWAKEFVNKIVREKDKILLSDNNILELETLGYSIYDIENILSSLSQIIINVESTIHQLGKAKDLSQKRNVPKRDALHALIARDNHAILITLDIHFNNLRDVILPRKPQDLI